MSRHTKHSLFFLSSRTHSGLRNSRDRARDQAGKRSEIFRLAINSYRWQLSKPGTSSGMCSSHYQRAISSCFAPGTDFTRVHLPGTCSVVHSSCSCFSFLLFLVLGGVQTPFFFHRFLTFRCKFSFAPLQIKFKSKSRPTRHDTDRKEPFSRINDCGQLLFFCLFVPK